MIYILRKLTAFFRWLFQGVTGGTEKIGDVSPNMIIGSVSSKLTEAKEVIKDTWENGEPEPEEEEVEGEEGIDWHWCWDDGTPCDADGNRIEL